MAWENIEERLKKAFSVKVSFPSGTVWLPDTHVNIDDWLTTIAESDEELRELDISRVQFLQNRWPIEKLLELEWDNQSNMRTIWAMRVGRRAYILLSDGIEYQLIAAIEPKNKPTLYRAVIGKVLQNPKFVPARPTHFRNSRPDLVPDIFENLDEPRDHGAQNDRERNPVFGGENFGGMGGPVDWMHPGSNSGKAMPKETNLSKLLLGWIGAWIDLPVLGYSHEDVPDSITTPEKGKFVMKYKPTYGDKQREAEKNQNRASPESTSAARASEKQLAEQSKSGENRPREDEGAV
jgi:hypothetical protein